MFCKSCKSEIVFVLIYTLAEQFHVHKSYKMRESTLSRIENFEENIGLSRIHLAVCKHKVEKKSFKSYTYQSIIALNPSTNTYCVDILQGKSSRNLLMTS